MPAKLIELYRITRRSELAEALDVPISALDVVTLSCQCCKTAGCSLFAAQYNFGRCILHSQTWFPREFDRFGQPAANRRGYGLYGPQFLRNYTGKVASSCCCSSALCEKLGYNHSGMFRFPTKPDQVATAARVLGLSAVDKQRAIDAPRSFHIAPWHYHPCHRSQDANGKWSLQKLKTYKDADGVVFSFAPPNSSVQAFIDEQSLSSGLMRGEVDDTLPPWFRSLARQQQEAGGP